MNVRRVVTGHDDDGKAIVVIDQVTDNVVSSRPGHSATVIWQTSEFPADNNDPGDPALIPTKTVNPDGTVFRIVEWGPGASGRVHRTDSVDYALVLAGEVDLELDDSKVSLRAGDCVVQRGTIHRWVNTGNVPCVVAFVLIAAQPVVAGGKVLGPAG